MSSSRSAGGREEPLPAGWEEHKDEYGRSYYYHANTEESTWTRPIQVAVDTGDRSYYVVIKSESERRQFFAGVYRELRAAMPLLPRTQRHPTRKGKMVPVKVPTMVELYKAARHQDVAPQAFASFISKQLNDFVGSKRSKANRSSLSSSKSVLCSRNKSPRGGTRRAGKSRVKSLRKSRRSGGHAHESESIASTSSNSSAVEASSATIKRAKAEMDATPRFSPNPLTLASPRLSKRTHKRTFNQRVGATSGKDSEARATKRIALSSTPASETSNHSVSSTHVGEKGTG